MNSKTLYKILHLFIAVYLVICTQYLQAEHFNLAENSEYKLELFSTNYNSKSIHNFILKIKLQDNWKLLFKNKNEKNINPIISVINHTPIQFVNLILPKPILGQDGESEFYKNEIVIP